MNPELTRALLDSFYLAEQTFTTLPPLPDGMTPQYVHIIDAIMQIEQKNGSVCVSDVAVWFHISVPGITRSIRALEQMGIVEKIHDDKDRRVVHITLTGKGRKWHGIYVEEYHAKLAEVLSGIPETDARTTIATIKSVVNLMKSNPITLEN
ncbi:MAG: MarR family winged helix-turn-helix transcriptional regulator [Candidatus Weimeria sp.]